MVGPRIRGRMVRPVGFATTRVGDHQLGRARATQLGALARPGRQSLPFGEQDPEASVGSRRHAKRFS